MDIVTTGSISSKISKNKIIHPTLRPGYTLYAGSQCNDGRPITESWKYKQAMKMGIPIVKAHAKPALETIVEAKELLVEKYKPKSVKDIIGHKTEIQQITAWLQSWENGIPNERGVIVTGPPGIGKTTTVHLIATSLGYKVTEYNASDSRSVSVLRGMFALGMKRLTKEVIVMDEVDGLCERGGVGEIAAIIKKSLVPMICIANQKPPKMKPLLSVCLDVKFSRPTKTTIAAALLPIAKSEGITISKVELEGLCERNGNDIRAMLNQLEFYGEETAESNADKDNTHKLDLFSATQKLMSNKRLSWDEATDLVYVDYFMVPLMVQEAYLTAGKSNLEDIEYASSRISDGDILNKRLFQTHDWSLLPHIVNTTVSVAKTVKGPAPFQIFPQFLGKNSKRMKHHHWVSDLAERVGCASSVMRLDYMGPMKQIITSKLLENKPDIKGVIDQLDGMKMTREDLMETLVDISFQPIEVPTKTKTAFTREWNKTHKGSTTINTKKRKMMDEDNDEEEDNEEEEISELEKELGVLELDD